MFPHTLAVSCLAGRIQLYMKLNIDYKALTLEKQAVRQNL